MASFREFPILYNIYDENISWLSSENKARLASGNSTGGYSQQVTQGLPEGNYTVWHPQLVNFLDGRQFSAAPKWFSINGYVYGNTPVFEMCLDDNVSLSEVRFTLMTSANLSRLYGGSMSMDRRAMCKLPYKRPYLVLGHHSRSTDCICTVTG
jgi:hypothetical protein